MRGPTGFARAFLLCVVVACGSSKPSTAGPACDTLLACCSSLAAVYQPDCEADAEESSEVACEAQVADPQGSDYCVGAMVDAGTTGQSQACVALGFCCLSLPNPADLDCAEVYEGGDEAQCTRSLARNGCSGDASAPAEGASDASYPEPCTLLSNCCSTVLPSSQNECEEAALTGESEPTEANQSACRMLLASDECGS